MESNETADNSSHRGIRGIYDLTQDDTNWVMTSSFIIFTMQTGFGMLESGCVSVKNEVNIMMKNVVDVVLGGLSYWLFGFGLSFGQGALTTPFMAVGEFLLDAPNDDPLMGPVMAAFLFQLSFATTATTIVSGAMAERCNFKAYCIFSFLNTAVYCIPAGWVWGEHGFLYKMGVVDIAGSGPVHLIGGSSAFAGALMLGPRLGRYENGPSPLPLGCPVNAVMGLFVLWWGWLAFNSGSTYGLSGAKWQYSARAAVCTMLSSFGGGCMGIGYSMVLNDGRLDMMDLINSILGALVSITGMSAIWGVVAVGLFAENPYPLTTTSGRSGLFKGGGWYMLGVQSLSVVCLASWGIVSNIVLLWVIDKVIPIRMDAYEELVGADLVEHSIHHSQAGVSRALSALGPIPGIPDKANLTTVGMNAGHDLYIEKYFSKKLGGLVNKAATATVKDNKDKTTKNKVHPLTALGTVREGDNFEPKYAWLD